MVNNRVAFFGPQYGMGGAGRVCASIGKALAQKGYDVDFIVDGSYSQDSYLQDDLPENSRVVCLTGTCAASSEYNLLSCLKILYSLTKYLSRENDSVLISNLTKFNLLAVWASTISRTKTSLVLVEHSLVSPHITGRNRLLPLLIKAHYPIADQILSVSSDVAEDLYGNVGLNANQSAVIRNPIDVEEVISRSHEEVSHKWFSEDIPVIVGVGRFVKQKQFSVLLEAFEQLKHWIEVRLVMIGDGPQKQALSELAVELGIEDRVDFLGFISNPYKYMRRADLLGISSRVEGHPVVALEALACGTPIVSTDCPGGNSEILNDGEYGELVDVGDPDALADAMVRTLDDPPDPERLVERAKHYRVDKVADRYAEVIERAA